MYLPRPLAEPAGPVAAALALHARRRELTIYAGAGVSAADPAALPGAARLAQLIHESLSHHLDLTAVESDDLLAVADAVAAESRGDDLLRMTILQVADLLGAHENFAHEVLGLLLCEGVVTILETNFDNCIERAAQPECPTVVRTAGDLLQASGPALLKAHGCATQPKTMIVTTAQLAEAPPWATVRVAAQLRQDQVVFLGIGSVADYIRNSINEILEEVGVEHLLVVDPAMASWDTAELAWKDVLPVLRPDQRDPRTADEFCDALLRAYAMLFVNDLKAAVHSMDPEHPQRKGTSTLVQRLAERDAVWGVRWLRSASHRLPTGSPTVGSSEAIRGALAIGALVGVGGITSLTRGGVVRVNADGHPIPVLLLMNHTGALGTVAEPEARRRVHFAKGQDLIDADADVVVVAVGHVGPVSGEIPVNRGHRLADILRACQERAQVLPANLLAVPEADHVINGVMSGNVWIINGDDLIEAA